MSETYIVEKNQPHEECGSSDAVQVYSDGHAHCYSCATHIDNWEKYLESNDVQPSASPKEQTLFARVPALDLETINGLSSRGFRERGVDKRTTSFFGVVAKVNEEGTITDHFYPYTAAGQTVAYKRRTLPKTFSTVGDFKDIQLFGQSLFRPGKRIVVTEGEMDALAYAQACLDTGSTAGKTESGELIPWPVVALPSASATKTLRANREWLRSFGEVVLWIDNDEAGEKILDTAAKIIGYGKVKVANSVEKDANETLLAKGPKEVMRVVWDAKPYSPAGIYNDVDEIKAVMERDAHVKAVPYPPCLQRLNDKTRGMRPGTITLFTSGTGSGKTTLMREIMLHLLEETESKIGVVSLEESLTEVAKNLSAMQMKKNLAKEELSTEQLEPGLQAVFGDGRTIVLDHQGAINDGSMIDTLESMCIMGAQYLFVDHITILVSEGAEGLTGNEATDKVMNELLSLAKRHNVWIGLVSHLRKMTTVGQSFEDGKLASLDDIRGSGSIKQVSMEILAFARNLNAEKEIERNVIRMAVLKSRHTGLTGPCGTAVYDYDTGRLTYGGEPDGTAFDNVYDQQL